MARSLDQQDRDSKRKTYRLAFPSNLDAERITAWIRSVSGSLRANASTMTGTPTIAFEVWATNKGLTHRLMVPWRDADYVIAQLRSLVPGIRVTPEDVYPDVQWTAGVEVGLTNKSRTLRIYDPADTSATILASMQALHSGEAIVVQWVVTPAIPARPPIYRAARSHELNAHILLNGDLADRDEVNDRRHKLEEPNVLAVLRVGARASSNTKAQHLLNRVRNALSSTRSPSSRFVRRMVTLGQVRRRITAAAGSVVFPIQLSAPELTALIAWPIGNPLITGLPPALSRHLPATEAVPRAGRVLGRSNMPGHERAIAMSYDNARKHVHVAGPTGVGKTVLLANMIKQDMQQGHGVVLIERKGDLFHAALDYVPPQRINDVIVLDVNDTSRPVGFNILRQGNPANAVDELTGLFEHMYSDTRSVWTRQVLYHGLRTIAEHPELTFIDLSPLLVPMSPEESAWRDDIIRGVKDRELRNFWQRFQAQPRGAQEKITQPVMDRIWQLNARPEIRHIIGQSTSSFQMDDVVKGNKILLVNLAGVATETANLTGTLLMNALWSSVQRAHGRRPNYLYLDEFQDYINLPVDPEDMLAKARSFGLGMTLAHQHMAQLPTELRQAVMTNARTKIIFQTSGDDARLMAREFGNSVTEQDFTNLGNYETISRIATDAGISPPLTMTTNEPAASNGRARQTQLASRQTYGRPVAEVEASIDARRTVANKPRTKRPKIGNQGWG